MNQLFDQKKIKRQHDNQLINTQDIFQAEMWNIYFSSFQNINNHFIFFSKNIVREFKHYFWC